MTKYLNIHPSHPQARLIQQVVDVVQRGGVIVYPTDSGYALGCQLGNKEAGERIQQIRQLEKEHYFTLLCRDLSEISTYAKVSNPVFRLLKASTPGAYTFILQATREVPKRLLNEKRRTIGIRVPDNAITQAILEGLGEPLMSVSLIIPVDDEIPTFDIDELRERLNGQVDAIIDGGFCGLESTTVIDLTTGEPEILREGAGNVAVFR